MLVVVSVNYSSLKNCDLQNALDTKEDDVHDLQGTTTSDTL